MVTGLDNDKVRLGKAEALHMDYVVNLQQTDLKRISMELQTVTGQMLLLNVQVQFQQHDKVWIFYAKGFYSQIGILRMLKFHLIWKK